ncbi:hypothetical protein CPT_Moabite_017 [Serratia phage Moabite]|uniref:Uncharacterized protein n=3 Tax=Moabitevirus TaxID=2843422 RepID=A0A7T3NBR0_9CAUD|nr:hypothetical protein HWB23_gp287 [Serratia phage vB_SmaM_ 2050HW]YP_009849113.1 hypothetical protein HWC48_gp017 [Serratia phage Moabite]QPX76800.1 hypothetical protein [Serratia phage vB_SmaM_Yaphecito]UCR74560.1 hypothetical protein [Serratia phage BUCT660]UGO54235.1 hypothetical protein HAYMO_253 [Serratia phage vB_SmaM_Haymo]UQT03741.1 hypothetical protein KODAMA_02740 [Serratia phage vB_SmaM-Kodama]URG14131.1 hypothetical protein [Pectobacterium phage vB_ParM-25]
MIHYSLTFPCGLIERVSKKGDATIVTANIAKGNFHFNVRGVRVYDSSVDKKLPKEHKAAIEKCELYGVWLHVQKHGVPPKVQFFSDLPYYLDDSKEFPKFVQSFCGKDASVVELYFKPGYDDDLFKSIVEAAGRPVPYLNPINRPTLYDALTFDVFASAFNPRELKQNMSRAKG